MKNLIVVLAVFILASCATVDLNKPAQVADSAPYALEILDSYIGDDKITIDALVGPVASLENLYLNSRHIDSQSSLHDFYTANPHAIFLARANWQRVISAVGQYSVRTQKTDSPRAYKMA